MCNKRPSRRVGSPPSGCFSPFFFKHVNPSWQSLINCVKHKSIKILITRQEVVEGDENTNLASVIVPVRHYAVQEEPAKKLIGFKGNLPRGAEKERII